jgi:predicted TIM-barrel fold metal-dependent hydrolase
MNVRAVDIAERVGHPIIDADGHILEFTPAALPYLREAMGPVVFERYRERMSPLRAAMASPTLEERRMSRVPQAGWWGSPSRHAIDLATSMAPRLLHERLGDLGFSYAILYATSGMGSAGVQDDEVRVGLCRGFNDFFASVYGPFQDRITVAGIIPMNTVEEAVAELEHCKQIGLKVVGIPNGVLRPIKAPQASPWLLPGQSHWWDFFGLDSEHDYDPVWAKFEELNYAVTVHGGIGAPPTWLYTSITSWMANHIGSFAGMTYPTCKSLYLGGVTRRFPNLVFAFQECGVGWAPTLLADTTEHWEKRNLAQVEEIYDPSLLDVAELASLVRQYAPELTEGVEGDLEELLVACTLRGTPPEDHDEFAAMQINKKSDLADLFVPNFYFGCEADDRSTAYAYSPSNAFGAEYKPMLGSDISHFDVPDFSAVIPEAYKMVEKGILTAEQFKKFTFTNVCEMLQRADPELFVGTALEGAVDAPVAG